MKINLELTYPQCKEVLLAVVEMKSNTYDNKEWESTKFYRMRK
jgi:hypothetical protein